MSDSDQDRGKNGAESKTKSSKRSRDNTRLGTDATALYLHDMGESPLLTAEEEVELAKQIEAGLEAAEALRRGGDLDSSEWQPLQRAKEKGEEARARFIRSNTRLVVSIAKQFRGQGLQFLDLIQEGNLGLIKAVEEFDYTMGNRFSTYATYWIRQSIMRAIDNKSRTIRLPGHIRSQLYKLYQAMHSLEQELGHKPTPEELAHHLHQSPEDVRQLLRYGRMPTSLQKPVGKESDTELADLIADEESEHLLETVSKQLLAEDVDELLAKLPDREAEVLRLRYGLRDGKPRTLKAISEVFDVSRERIRQIEKRALRRLRSARSGARHLTQYLRR